MALAGSKLDGLIKIPPSLSPKADQGGMSGTVECEYANMRWASSTGLDWKHFSSSRITYVPVAHVNP